MKFTDGNWLHQPGVTPHYATEVYEIQQGENDVTLIVPCHPIRHRGDTLAGPVLTIKLWSPREGIIGVKEWHYEGVKAVGPDFELVTECVQTTTEITEEVIRFTSGSLTAIVDRKSFCITFKDGERVVTSSPSRGAAYMEIADDGAYCLGKLSLGVGENVYGLGERFTTFVKNGQVVNIWNEDGGTNSDQAYKNVPFYLTNRGYGVFVNHPGKVSFEVGSERTNLVQFSVGGESLEYFVVNGPTPKEVLNRYTALTGRAPVPPAWSFGLWLTTSFTTNYDEETVTSFIQGMADRDIPLSVFHYDCFWMKGMNWCDFQWDPTVFPDPKGMIDRLHARGLKVCVWINPYIAQASSLFAEGAAKGYFIKRANGDVWQWDMWQPGMTIVDFTNPKATEWYKSKLSALIDTGVDALKTDFGERIPTDAVYSDGSNPERMHNYYTQLYNQASYEILEEKKGEAVLFARSGTAGGQQFPCHWGGDCWSTFEAMAETLRGGLSLGLSGFGFWSHDIGGFEGKPLEALYKRWVAFGLLSSHSRLHGNNSYRVPWVYGDEACDVLRFFTKLKHRLMPYLWAKAWEANEQGLPLLRSMHLEFPDDPGCDALDRQYMLGDSILVAPIFSEDGVVDFYLPKGTWTHLLTGVKVEGNGWRRESHDFMSLPIYVKENTLLATGRDDVVDYDTRIEPKLKWYCPQESSVAVLRGPKGEKVELQARADSGKADIESEPSISWSWA